MNTELENDTKHFISLLDFIESQELPRVIADYVTDLAKFREELDAVKEDYFAAHPIEPVQPTPEPTDG